jgi:isopentenyl-diphosphate delta-isomerase
MGYERKSEHIDICLNENVRARHNYWDDVHLVHNALPELDMEAIDTSVELFGKELTAPIVISAITGGFDAAVEINRNLAKGTAAVGVGLGLGSQRPAIENPDLSESYEVVKEYEVPLVIANVGAPQLVNQRGKGIIGVEECKRALDMVDGDILAIHLNFLQEIVQPEGEVKATGCLDALGKVAKQMPVLAKETGAGMSHKVALALSEQGVAGLDVGGLGGTSFAAVEFHRAKSRDETLRSRLGQTFWDWGIPTPVSVIVADVGLPMIATGGLRTGLDVAKAVSLGASVGGLAGRMLASATESAEAVSNELQTLVAELKSAMFLVGASNMEELMDVPVVVLGETADWLNALVPEG